jgi:cell wall assembly regulator SMI1
VLPGLSHAHYTRPIHAFLELPISPLASQTTERRPYPSNSKHDMDMAASINDSWARIAAWLKANAPHDFMLLQGPVSPDELDAAAAHFGVELPEDFRRLYQLMNGTDPNGESVGLFPSADAWDDMAFGPTALEQIIREWDMQKELVDGGDFADLEPRSAAGVASDWWNTGWIPFAGNGGGDLYCVDLAPSGEGVKGQVITHSHETGEHKILAPSLAAYLSDLADGIEAGHYEYTDRGMQKIEAEG